MLQQLCHCCFGVLPPSEWIKTSGGEGQWVDKDSSCHTHKKISFLDNRMPLHQKAQTAQMILLLC